MQLEGFIKKKKKIFYIVKRKDEDEIMYESKNIEKNKLKKRELQINCWRFEATDI